MINYFQHGGEATKLDRHNKKAQDIRSGIRKANLDAKGSLVGHSTHKMQTEIGRRLLELGIKGVAPEKWYSFPTLFPDKKKPNRWVDYGGGQDEKLKGKGADLKGAYEEAFIRGEIFEFGTDKDAAIKFGEGSWKFQQGGEVMKKYLQPRAEEGNTDTVPAMLTPGEFVIRKDAVDEIGIDKLHALNNVDRLSDMSALTNYRPAQFQEGGEVKPEKFKGKMFKGKAVPYESDEWGTDQVVQRKRATDKGEAGFLGMAKTGSGAGLLAQLLLGGYGRTAALVGGAYGRHKYGGDSPNLRKALSGEAPYKPLRFKEMDGDLYMSTRKGWKALSDKAAGVLRSEEGSSMMKGYSYNSYRKPDSMPKAYRIGAQPMDWLGQKVSPYFEYREGGEVMNYYGGGMVRNKRAQYQEGGVVEALEAFGEKSKSADELVALLALRASQDWKKRANESKPYHGPPIPEYLKPFPGLQLRKTKPMHLEPIAPVPSTGFQQGGLAQPMAQGLAQPMAQGTAQPMAQGLAQPMAQGMAQPMARGRMAPPMARGRMAPPMARGRAPVGRSLGLQQGGMVPQQSLPPAGYMQEGGEVSQPMPMGEPAGIQERPSPVGERAYSEEPMDQLGLEKHEYAAYLKHGPEAYKYLAHKFKPQSQWSVYDSMVDAGSIDPYEVNKDDFVVMTRDVVNQLRAK